MPVSVPRQRIVSADVGPGDATAMDATAMTGTAMTGTGTGTDRDRNDLTLLVVEDDPAGALAVPELLDAADAAGTRVRIRTARNLTEAERLLTDDVHCVLVDLSLPGPRAAAGDDPLAPLRHILRLAPRHAVLALAASADAELAAEAVRVGAQDHLFREELDGRLLSRAIRYAVERKRADAVQVKLAESRLRAQENARLERGLLPTPSWRAPTCGSRPATGPAAPARCSAATSTTPCAPPTAPSTP